MEDREKVQEESSEEEQVQMSGTSDTAEPFEQGGGEGPATEADPPIIITGGGAS